jgi:hypothetical protein
MDDNDNSQVNESSSLYGDFKLDRSAFRASTAADANNHTLDWKNRSYSERLKGAAFLIRHAFGLSANTRMDRTIFAKRKR